MNKQTLSQWTYDGLGTVLDEDKHVVCREVRNHEDAKLIAAAPDLLKACKNTIKGMCCICDDGLYCDCDCEVVAQAKQVIKKAEGR